MLRGKWWEIYNDPELNALEEQLNINNQNIKQFFENFMVSRAWCARPAPNIIRPLRPAHHGPALARPRRRQRQQHFEWEQ